MVETSERIYRSGYVGTINAMDYLATAEETRRRRYEPKPPSDLRSMGLLGALLDQNGELREAEKLLTTVMEGNTSAHGRQHPDTAYSINSLTVNYYHQGRTREAVRLMEECISISERASGANNVSTSKYRQTLRKIQAKVDI